MNNDFYSLGMLITGRAWKDYPELGIMDVIAAKIADEENT